MGGPLHVAPPPRPATASIRPVSARSRVPLSARKQALVEEAIEPNFVKMDKKVLRYEAYFVEKVMESPDETERVRKCNIYFYLVDGSIHIGEPRVENSGIPQGVLLKRTKVHLESDTGTARLIEPSDFEVGRSIKIYGRVYEIADADAHTRKYAQQVLGITLAPRMTVPSDHYAAARDAATPRLKYLDWPRRAELSDDNDDDDDELASQRVKKDALRQFLENDRKVLKFNCEWDDRDTPYGLKKKYELLFFLADDTVQVGEVRERNDGCEAFPLLLVRQKLPKDGTTSSMRTMRGGSSQGEPDIVTADDLVCGGNVAVFGRNMRILSCDRFTRSYYASKGVRQIRVQDEAPSTRRPKITVPPHEGALAFGSEEDSLRCVYSLHPKPRPKNMEKLNMFGSKKLTFKCKFDSPHDDDKNRRFKIQYHLADDTITVMELALINEREAGKFLNRGAHRHRDPTSGKLARTRPDSFVIGGTIEICSHRFLIESATTDTLEYYEEHKAHFPFADASGILRRKLSHNVAALREACRRAEGGPTAFGEVSIPRFVAAAASCAAAHLSEHELITLRRAFPGTATATISYTNLCDAAGIAIAEVAPTASDAGDSLAKRISRARVGGLDLRGALMAVDAERNGYVTAETLEIVLADMEIDATDDDINALIAPFADEHGAIDYTRLCNAVLTPPPSPVEIVSAPPPPTPLEVAGAAVKSVLAEPTKRLLMGEIAARFSGRTYAMRKAMRKEDAARTGVLGKDVFFYLLGQHCIGGAGLSEAHRGFVLQHYFIDGVSDVDYNAFIKLAQQCEA